MAPVSVSNTRVAKTWACSGRTTWPPPSAPWSAPSAARNSTLSLAQSPAAKRGPAKMSLATICEVALFAVLFDTLLVQSFWLAFFDPDRGRSLSPGSNDPGFVVVQDRPWRGRSRRLRPSRVGSRLDQIRWCRCVRPPANRLHPSGMRPPSTKKAQLETAIHGPTPASGAAARSRLRMAKALGASAWAYYTRRAGGHGQPVFGRVEHALESCIILRFLENAYPSNGAIEDVVYVAAGGETRTSRHGAQRRPD